MGRSGSPTYSSCGVHESTWRGLLPLGLLPFLQKVAKYLPDLFFVEGTKSVAQLHGIAVAAVTERLDAIEDPEKRKGSNESRDQLVILQRLVQSKDSHGKPMPQSEITSEALAQLIAGSDTISNTTCATIYWIFPGERARPGTFLPRLHAELDSAIPENVAVAEWSHVSHLPFLRCCIHEAMRLHSTSAIGLPRLIPENAPAISFEDYHFIPGTVLSVPSYTIHYDASIWGPGVEKSNPDRRAPGKLMEQQKTAFTPFIYGPKACVGRNIAEPELSSIIATFFRRYDIRLYQNVLESHEGFSKKPDGCWVGLKRRGGYLS